MHKLIEAIRVYLQRVSTYDPWVVIAQMILIGCVVWLAMRFLRGTRGARLLKGTALVLGLVFVAVRLLPGTGEWKRIEFLFGNFLLFVLVAFVVAFQPELRRALISIGQARFFRTRHSEIEEMVDELIQSAAFLSRNKIGAIMAIERTVGLGALVESGTRLDATLTADLINTIFYPGTALHDMGAIIHEGRLAAAGCQFPMAESEEVDPSLGSRHRAALGLAKDSDAVILVVSEETGRIALAYEGQLFIGLEQKNLRDLLMGLLAPKRMRGGKVPMAEGDE
ncbi:MAG: TIGR00159 family protein [Planctomycetes bacterium]|jgi:diadenylate cyclase|nr:diadenylate cyclase [Phycisphaerae bacterium]NBB96309.1 TIGR00159 family protein [Planctomycetota bacterium]